MSSEAQVKNFLNFVEKLCSVLKIFKFFLFLIISWLIKSVTSWLVLANETGCIFKYLLNDNLLSHQTWPIDRYKRQQYFLGIFWTIWRTGGKFQAPFNLAVCSNYLTTNYVMITVLYFFEKVNKGQSKMTRSRYSVHFIKSYKGLELSSIQPKRC